MILQFDIEDNKIVHKWESVEKIRQHTSYDENSIKKAIEDSKPYGGCLWLNYCKQ